VTQNETQKPTIPTESLSPAEARKQDLARRVRNDFTYHRPPAEVGPTFVTLREKAKELGLLIVEHVPAGREQATALTRLEEAVMHANAGIARQYPVEPVAGA
jgi:hypothetical protein